MFNGSFKFRATLKYQPIATNKLFKEREMKPSYFSVLITITKLQQLNNAYWEASTFLSQNSFLASDPLLAVMPQALVLASSPRNFPSLNLKVKLLRFSFCMDLDTQRARTCASSMVPCAFCFPSCTFLLPCTTP